MNSNKYLVVSDIHGALSGAEAIQNALAHHNLTHVLCLGDILYHGPRNDLPEDYAPKKVIPLMNALKDQILAVRGNCEAEVDQMVLDFACTADYNAFFMNSRTVFMSHGHVYGPSCLPKICEGSVFLSGHTHIPTAEKKNGIYLCNPGSISLPKGGFPRSYGVLTDTDFTVYALDHSVVMQVTF